MTELTHREPRKLAHTLKEAVASSVLHRTYDRLRGAGPAGLFVYREKPAKVLHTQYLLPRRKPDANATTYLEKDDVTTPSHIGTVGMSFQIADRKDRAFTVSVRGAIYMRVLPTEEDLMREPFVVFRLSRQAQSLILRRRSEAVRDAFESNKSSLGPEGKKSAAWRQIRDRAIEAAQAAAMRELHIDSASLPSMGARDTVVSILGEADEASTSDDPTTSIAAATGEQSIIDNAGDGEAKDTAAQQQDASDDSSSPSERYSEALRAFEFIVRPGATKAPPEALVEREQIPQKWLRLEMNFGSIRIDLSKSEAEIQADIDSFNNSMRDALEKRIDAWIEDPDPVLGGKAWAFPAGTGMQSRTLTPKEVAEWARTLEILRSFPKKARPQIQPALEMENLPDPLRTHERTVRIILANESDLLDPKTAAARESDAGIYQVEMAVEFEPDLHREIRLERIEPSYRYNAYLSHMALGINCGIRRRSLTAPHILETTALPTYYQPLTEPFEINPAPRFEDLGKPDGGVNILKGLLTAYQNWLLSVERTKPYERGLDPVLQAEEYAREKGQFDRDLQRWQEECSSIARGVRIIERAAAARNAGKSAADPEVIPLTAWRFMNQTFARYWKSRGVEAWRLFQVSFILAQLPSLVSRIPHWANAADIVRGEDDNEVALLYFSTGGGKSESFFGLLLFALVLDRLRGKHLGITALIRYPLRLLTSQQAFRLAQILAAAQETRWYWEDEGFALPGRSFEIGFWVGGNNTPNNPSARGMDVIPKRTDSWDELAQRQGDYSVYHAKWVRLAICPYCRGHLVDQNGRRHTTIGLRRFREGPDERLGHFCFNKMCNWNRRHGQRDPLGPYPLPIHIMDSDIYAHAPAVLLGTVDKLALIGQSAPTIARVLGMFGFPAWIHSQSQRFVSPSTREQFLKGPGALNCAPVWPFYQDGQKLFFDPYPSLEIQDEAHLLDESLGTFAGLFETTFHHALRELAPLLQDQIVRRNGLTRPPKIVAASATVTDPERQIDQIYQRSVRMFPHPGPDLYESFYARLHRPMSGDPSRDHAANPEHRSPNRRRYVSIMTNGRTHTAATVAVLSAFHLTISTWMKTLIEGDDALRWAVRREMAEVLPDDVFRGSHRRLLLDPSITHDGIANAVDLVRIALLYVTNKKGGDNVKAALQDIVRRDHRLSGLPQVAGIKTALITGAIDAGLISAVVNEASTRPTPGTPFSFDAFRNSLRCVIATSAISHGVDVDEFNMMFFAGQPADIAEYIQASSRVGRAHVGTSVLIPTPQQRRDRYIVETHEVFHRFLERMIHPASVERWAELAINRCLASFFQLKICGVDYIRNMNAANSADAKAALAEPDNVGEIGERSRNDHIRLIEDLRDFVTTGIGLYHATSPTNKVFYRDRIHDLFDRATTAMETINWRSELLAQFFRQPRPPLSRPMTSLRDVDEAGVIEGGFGTGSDRVSRKDIGKVMAALIRGANHWGTGEAGG